MDKDERLFFALWPAAELQKVWATTARELLPDGAGRLVPVSNLHMTLLYIGEVTAEKRAELELMAGEISFVPFVLRLDKFGYWRRPRVWWCGATETPEQLQRLVDSLRSGAKTCGLEVDQRPYKAHLTLARKVSRSPGQQVAQPYDWHIKQFALVRSILSPGGAQYEVQRCWPILKQG